MKEPLTAEPPEVLWVLLWPVVLSKWRRQRCCLFRSG